MRRIEEFAWFTATVLLLTGAKARTANLPQLGDDLALGKSGGIYFHVLTKDINDSTKPTTVSIELYDDDHRQFMTMEHVLGKNADEVNEIWIAKPGLYRMVRVRYGDRSWVQWKNSKLVLVRSGELSNLGTLVLKAGKGDGLSLALRRTQTNYKFEKDSDSPFHAVIDGFAGKTQLVKRGQHAGKLNRVGPGGTYVASYSYYRQVALSYDVKVNNNKHATPLLHRIDSDRTAFQQCYTEQVNGERSGKIRFQFKVDPKSQRLDSLRLVHSDLAHRALENCLNNQLEAIDYSGGKGLKGTITFKFDVGQDTL